MQEIFDLIEKRHDALKRDTLDGKVSRVEYIAIKAELMAIEAAVDTLSDSFEIVPLFETLYPAPEEGA